MTHDQLLAKIDNNIEEISFKEIHATLAALRAVVKMHHPIKARISMDDYNYIGCGSCTSWSHEGDSHLEYPCPTIQAIEKELND